MWGILDHKSSPVCATRGGSGGEGSGERGGMGLFGVQGVTWAAQHGRVVGLGPRNSSRPTAACLHACWPPTPHPSCPLPYPPAGDRAMGLQSLPVAFGVETAKWICVSSIDVTQVGEGRPR